MRICWRAPSAPLSVGNVADTLVLALALLGVACLPAVVAVILCADEIIDRVVCGISEWRERRRERRTISQLDRVLEVDSLTREIDLTEFDRITQPSIEQIAADLRRLGRQRLGVASRSRVWQKAVLEAYDDRLRLASRSLGIAEHLAGLDGVDRDIERVRVEGELQAAGLVLPAVADHRRWRP